MYSKISKVQLFYYLICLYMHLNTAFADILHYDKSIIEDAHLETHGLIRKYGRPAEVHRIHTKDGFVLTAHRMPRAGGQPVLLVHGLEDSSATWVMMGTEKGLGYLLHGRRYDVWMLNVRGNHYSRKHLRYHRLMPKFWDFSFHEVGIYDLPAAIDYVLGQTGYQQLHFIGHSQGTTSFWVLGSEQPAYMRKIKLMQALAPVAYFDNIQGPIVKAIAPYAQGLYRFAKLSGLHEYPPENEVLLKLLYKLCSFALPNTCLYFIFQTMGLDVAQLNATMLPVILGHAPSGSSVKSLIHYGQLYGSGGFYKFNYDKALTNFVHYGSTRPPQYKLKNVNCKVALYYGKNDWLAAVKDVHRLRDVLPNVVHDELIAYEKFNHIDFVWAKDVKKLLYDSMFSVMQRVDNGEL